MTLALRASEGGTIVPLRVRPSAGRESVGGEHGGALRVAVNAPPERGRANRAVEDAIAGALGVPRSSVRIVSGETSRTKAVWVPLEPGAVRAKLESR